METGARKDLRSVQNIGIISTKFLYFGYLPFGTFGKEFLLQLYFRLKSMKFLDNRAMDVRKE